MGVSLESMPESMDHRADCERDSKDSVLSTEFDDDDDDDDESKKWPVTNSKNDIYHLMKNAHVIVT